MWLCEIDSVFSLDCKICFSLPCTCHFWCRVIIFPINAPGMGRFKLFDLVVWVRVSIWDRVRVIVRVIVPVRVRVSK